MRLHLKFKAVDYIKKYFTFILPLQSNAWGLKFEHFSDWGLEVVEKPYINLISCSKEEHRNRYHFFNTLQMLTTLEKEVSDTNADDQSLLLQDLVNLHQTQDGIGKYRNTRYHCSGIPFIKTYYEVDWTTQLYHCLIDGLVGTNFMPIGFLANVLIFICLQH